MGKNSALKTLGRRVGNVVLHSLLIKHTNRPESGQHLRSEEIEYRNAAIKKARNYNWDDEDKDELKKIAIDFIRQKKIKKYADVDFSIKEAEKLVEREIRELEL